MGKTKKSAATRIADLLEKVDSCVHDNYERKDARITELEQAMAAMLGHIKAAQDNWCFTNAEAAIYQCKKIANQALRDAGSDESGEGL